MELLDLRSHANRPSRSDVMPADLAIANLRAIAFLLPNALNLRARSTSSSGTFDCTDGRSFDRADKFVCGALANVKFNDRMVGFACYAVETCYL
jgi:hypothetical protein